MVIEHDVNDKKNFLTFEFRIKFRHSFFRIMDTQDALRQCLLL
jgi:hypothetical protein